MWGSLAQSACRAAASAKDVCLATSVLCALAPLCPCSAGPVPEPSFALCLDVLAPYLNQVNLIRAGVPKIVSRLPSAAFPGQRLRWAAALFSGTS